MLTNELIEDSSFQMLELIYMSYDQLMLLSKENDQKKSQNKEENMNCHEEIGEENNMEINNKIIEQQDIPNNNDLEVKQIEEEKQIEEK